MRGVRAVTLAPGAHHGRNRAGARRQPTDRAKLAEERPPPRTCEGPPRTARHWVPVARGDRAPSRVGRREARGRPHGRRDPRRARAGRIQARRKRSMMDRRIALLVAALLCSCSDDTGETATSASEDTGTNFTVCSDCPLGAGYGCPDGQVCAAITPGGGGVCLLACDQSPAPECSFEGSIVGQCKMFGDAMACNDAMNGPVCPPQEK